MSVRLQQCAKCHKLFFPFRHLCSACGSREFGHEDIDAGVVEEVTQLSDGVRIASVRASEVLLVGSSLSEVEPGASVTIDSDGSGPDTEISTLFIPSSPFSLNQEMK